MTPGAARVRPPLTLQAGILPLRALAMAAWPAGGRLEGLVHHVDHGSSYLATVCTDRIAELGATPSTGTVGDSFDDAMTEALNKGTDRTETQAESDFRECRN